MVVTRRDFTKTALAAFPASVFIASTAPARAQGAAKPNSRWAGVHVGMNAPYNFGTGNYTTGEEILKRCLQLGCSATELRAQPVELFMGSPVAVAGAAAAGRGRAAGAAPGPSAAETAQAARRWRLSTSLEKVAEFRRMYDAAGVAIEIVKWDGILGFSEPEIAYACLVTKALGARALSTEIGPAGTEKVGPIVASHGLIIGYHGHTETGDADWERVFAQSPGNGANVDIGHYLGGHKTSPIPFIEKYHERVTHIHVKDKTLANVNVPFGQGDTPIIQALRLIRDKKWNIQATIEFEYPVPAGSERMAEIAKCLEYCKQALNS
jgi:hypothetical protein